MACCQAERSMTVDGILWEFVFMADIHHSARRRRQHDRRIVMTWVSGLGWVVAKPRVRLAVLDELRLFRVERFISVGEAVSDPLIKPG